MAKKFKTLDDDNEKVLPDIPPEPYTGICLHCSFYSVQPEWFGPHCTNKLSPFSGKRKSETGTCDFGSSKPIPASLPVDEDEPDPDTGLFDIDPKDIKHDDVT